MDHDGNQLDPSQSSTEPIDREELVRMERRLTQMEHNLTQKREEGERGLHAITRQLESIKIAKSGLSEILHPDTQQTDPASSTKQSTRINLFESWAEYREAGYTIPEECLASPSELRQIITDLPIPADTRESKVWVIKKERNLAALRLMAARIPDGRFRLFDFANVLRAVGFYDGPTDRFQTTLTRHMGSFPAEWENLGKGFWKFLKAPPEPGALHAYQTPSEVSEPTDSAFAPIPPETPADSTHQGIGGD